MARRRTIALLAAGVLATATPALAQDDLFSKIKLCPPVIAKTCYVAYVTGQNRVLVLMSSDAESAIGGSEVGVFAAPEQPQQGQAAVPLDLAEAQGRIVMLDGNGGDGIYGAKLVETASPLLTSLYLSVFFGADQGPAAPEEGEEEGVPPIEPPGGAEGQPPQ